MVTTSHRGYPLAVGKTIKAIEEAPTAAGTTTFSHAIDSDSVLVSLFASSVSGTLDVKVVTETTDGKELDIITFPQLSAATSNLVLRKAASTMSKIKIVVTYSDACDYQVYIRAIAAGEASIRILGANQAKASQTTVTTAGGVVALIPSSLTDRAGVIVLNNNISSGVLYIGFTIGETTTAVGYPIYAGQPLGIDVAAGVTVYALADGADVDVRLLEA